MCNAVKYKILLQSNSSSRGISWRPWRLLPLIQAVMPQKNHYVPTHNMAFESQVVLSHYVYSLLIANFMHNLFNIIQKAHSIT